MQVTILLSEQLSMFELASALELFALERPEFELWYQCELVSFGQSKYSGLCGINLEVKQVDQLPKADLIVIPSYPVKQTNLSNELRQQLLDHYHNGGRLISFCSGSFLLAQLGLLNGREAVTHWRYKEQFKSRFPHIKLNEEVLYRYDGKIGCSAGSAAGIDLGIQVIRQDFGFEKANKVARRLVLPAHRNGGQAQFVEKAVTKHESQLSATLDWVVKNLNPDINITDLANKANMTRRTFDRHFKKHYQMTPQRWLIERKLESAKALLETTDYGIEKIAILSGFDSSVTLRHNFNKYLSVSPSLYRSTFSK